MRVFVTGATGFVGSAVVQELLAAGHDVLGLARSDSSASALAATGARVHRGSMEEPSSLREAVAQADGVIHTAFNHDFSRFLENCELDRRAIDALGTALEGSARPLLVTSGFAQLAQGRPAVESDRPPVGSANYPRLSEAAADGVATRGVRASVVRLAPSVHGDGDHGFVPFLIALARERGAAAYIGDGANRWAGVHRLDAARLFRLAIEANASGARFHAAGDEGVPFREIAQVIGRRLGVPVVSKAAGAEAAEHFGWMAPFAAMDMSAKSAETRATLGWQPTHPGLLEDIDRVTYFPG